jgi:hypothetical protein
MKTSRLKLNSVPHSSLNLTSIDGEKGSISAKLQPGENGLCLPTERSLSPERCFALRTFSKRRHQLNSHLIRPQSIVKSARSQTSTIVLAEL